MALHNPHIALIQMACACGWVGELRDSKREADSDFSDHLVEIIHNIRHPCRIVTDLEKNGDDNVENSILDLGREA